MHRFAGLREVLDFDNWPTLLMRRLFDRKTGLVVYRKGGLEILIDHLGGDENGTRVCIVTDMYSRYLPSVGLRGPARVLDLGANGGGFPLMLRIAGVELARVVCVEMNPLTYQRLAVNLSTNFGSSAVAINAAVCGMPKDSEILLKPIRGSTSNSMYADRAEAAMSHVSVRTTTLGSLYDQYFKDDFIDLCKIDIEGAEFELFESSPDEVLRKIKYLIIEFHDRSKTPAVVERLAGLGFMETTIKEGSETGSATEVRSFRGPAG